MRTLPVVMFTCALATGCGGHGSHVPAPTYDVDSGVQAVLDAYDKNKSGSIDVSEAEACPALKSAFRAMDANRDGVISADELRQRFTRYDELAAGFGPIMVTCQVLI